MLKRRKDRTRGAYLRPSREAFAGKDADIRAGRRPTGTRPTAWRLKFGDFQILPQLQNSAGSCGEAGMEKRVMHPCPQARREPF